MKTHAAFVCAVFGLIFGSVAAVPVQQEQQEDAATGAGGLGTVLWSVLDDCFGGDDDAVACLKTRALTALDRALVRPNVALADGVSLAARAGKALQAAVDPQAEKADRVALDAAKDPERRNALLDEMLANRVDRLVSTRTIVLDAPVGQEGESNRSGAFTILH